MAYEPYPKWIFSELLGHDMVVQNQAEHDKHVNCVPVAQEATPPSPTEESPAKPKNGKLADLVKKIKDKL